MCTSRIVEEIYGVLLLLFPYAKDYFEGVPNTFIKSGAEDCIPNPDWYLVWTKYKKEEKFAKYFVILKQFRTCLKYHRKRAILTCQPITGYVRWYVTTDIHSKSNLTTILNHGRLQVDHINKAVVNTNQKCLEENSLWIELWP